MIKYRALLGGGGSKGQLMSNAQDTNTMYCNTKQNKTHIVILSISHDFPTGQPTTNWQTNGRTDMPVAPPPHLNPPLSPPKYGDCLMEYGAVLMKHRALFIKYGDFWIKYGAPLMKHRALLMRCMALLIEYRVANELGRLWMPKHLSG